MKKILQGVLIVVIILGSGYLVYSLVFLQKSATPSFISPTEPRAEQGTSANGYTKYTNEQIGYSIEYPASWQVLDDEPKTKKGLKEVTFQSPDYKDTQISLYHSIVESGSKVVISTIYYQQTLDEYMEGLPAYLAKSKEKVSIGDRQALRVVLGTQDNFLDVIGTRFIEDGILYKINYFYDTGGEPPHLEEYENMLTSLVPGDAKPDDAPINDWYKFVDYAYGFSFYHPIGNVGVLDEGNGIDADISYWLYYEKTRNADQFVINVWKDDINTRLGEYRNKYGERIVSEKQISKFGIGSVVELKIAANTLYVFEKDGEVFSVGPIRSDNQIFVSIAETLVF